MQRTRLRLLPKSALFAVALVSVACPGRAQSQQKDGQSAPSLKQLSLDQLGQIEITTVSKEPQAILKTAAAIFVITGDEIKRSGATSIPEALRLAPGVEVARIDSNKWSIGIRGFGSRLSRSVLVLIDGRTVYTTLFDGTYWEVQDTVMADIDRIEVIRGPGGTIWGPNAVNGVINVITKDASATQGFLADAGGGNEEQGFADLRYGGKKGPNLSYRVYGKGFNRGSEYHPDGHNFDSWSSIQGGFRVDWAKNQTEGFTLQGDIYDERAGESVEATTYSPPASIIVDGDAHLSGGNIMARWKKTFSEGSDIQLQAYYDRTNRHELNLGELRDTFDVDYVQRHRLPWRQQLSWGIGARASHADELMVVTGLIFDPSMKTDTLFTGFVQDQIQLIDDRLFLEVGTKAVRTNFTGLEFEPSVRLLWAPTAKQSVWIAYTHAVRTPSDVERDLFLSHFIGIDSGSGLPFFARFNGNRNFASEQLNGYELGYRRVLGKNAYLDVASFYNHYHDLLSEDITGPSFTEMDPAPTHLLLPAQFGNGLRGTTTGFEIAPDWRPTTFWRLHGSYSFLHMNLQRSPGSLDVGTAPGIVGSSPQHQVVAQTDFDLPKAFQLNFTLRYVSALPGLGVPAYATGDARLGWRLREHVELSVVGRNLFQGNHAEFAGDPGPLIGAIRSGYIKLTYSK